MTAREMLQSFGKRSMLVDLGINTPFVLLSSAFGVGGMVLAEQWETAAEILRIGNTHLNNRALRLSAAQYRGVVFSGAGAVYLLTLAVVYRRHAVVS